MRSSIVFIVFYFFNKVAFDIPNQIYQCNISIDAVAVAVYSDGNFALIIWIRQRKAIWIISLYLVRH